MLRGAIWLGLYLVLILLPWGASLIGRLAEGTGNESLLAGIGMVAGTLAFSLMAAEFGLVARIKSAGQPFGTDALMYFHRLMGIAALGFLVAHPLALIAAGYPAGLLSPLAGSLADRCGALGFWMVLLLVLLAVCRRRLGIAHEHWHMLHMVLALGAVLGGLVHLQVRLFARGEVALAGLFLAYGLLFVLLLADYRLLRPARLAKRRWRVSSNRDEGASTRTLVLVPDGHGGLSFAPGQFAWLATGGSPYGFRQHPITISSSAEAAGTLEFSVKALGDWSGSEVPGLAPGHVVYVDGPYGSFTPDRLPAEGLLLIGGGVGITPMRSIVLSLRDRGDRRPVILVHAAHDPARAIFRTELAALQERMNLRLIPVYEAGPAGDGARQGMVNADLLREILPPGVARWQCFICGPAPMTQSVEAALGDLGIPAGRIHAERFDMV